MSSSTGRELVVSPQQQQQPIIVFQGLSDDQFKQALTLFQPRPPTKQSLMIDAEKMKQIGVIAGYLEGIKYNSTEHSTFSEPIVINHFDNVMTTMMKDRDETFSINEWFADTRGQLPPEWSNYNPNEDANGDYMPAPEYKGLNVDWIGAVINQELDTPGFVSLFYNCIHMQRAMHSELQQSRTAGRSAIGGDLFTSHRAAPAPIYDSTTLHADLTTADLLRYQSTKY